MEKHILEKIEKNRAEHYEIDKLYKEHLELEKELEEMSKIIAFTPGEQNKFNVLKKKKLAGKEKLLELLEKIPD